MDEAYLKRLNKAFSFIEKNLEKPLNLNLIAQEACYSPFHLHRIFKAVTNETVNNYIIRKRVEKAAQLLLQNTKMSISEIAFKTGFSSNATLSRTFSKYYSESPITFRNNNTKINSKIGKELSKNSKNNYITEAYVCNLNNLKNWTKMNAQIEIKNMPQIKLAYITQIGEKGIETTFSKIVQWSNSKGLLANPNTNIMRVFHDSFKITDAQKVRMSIGISLQENIMPDEIVSLTNIEAGKFIVGRFEISIKEFEQAWNSLFIWMNENGYKKSEYNPYEIYYNNPSEHPQNKYEIDLCIPIL